jgi:hypothetical protein
LVYEQNVSIGEIEVDAIDGYEKRMRECPKKGLYKTNDQSSFCRRLNYLVNYLVRINK